MINRAIHTYLFSAALTAGCFFVFGCRNSMEEVRALAVKRSSQDIAENVESYMSQGGKVRAKLTSPVMVRTVADTPVVEFPKTLHVIFYTDSTKPESYLFARYGRYLEKEGKILLRDSVTVHNVKGDTLWTDELWWDRNLAKFYTDKHVLIHQPMGQVFEGNDGMEADQEFKSWTLFNGSGIRNMPDSTMP